jgi:hypothetical protein
MPRLLRALAPYVLAQLALIAAVFLLPALVHQLDAPAPPPSAAAPASDQDIVRQMEEMARPPEDAASAPGGGQ